MNHVFPSAHQVRPGAGAAQETEESHMMPEHGRNSGETPHAAELAPKPTLLDQMGGPSGLVYTGLPVVVFVVANSVFGLQGGIWSAIGIAVAITVLRLVRKEPIRPAVSGLIGVGVAAFIAYQTGSAKGSSSWVSGRAS